MPVKFRSQESWSNGKKSIVVSSEFASEFITRVERTKFVVSGKGR